MSAWKLKPVSDTAWILEKDGNRHSMVSATDQGLRVIGPLKRKLYADLADLSSELGSDVAMEPRDADGDAGEEIGQVDGYPIKHSQVFDVVTEEIVTYSKTSGGRARFAAGYYAIRFDHGWTASYCPRLSTLTDNAYIGPFRSKLEMQNAISAKKREIEL